MAEVAVGGVTPLGDPGLVLTRADDGPALVPPDRSTAADCVERPVLELPVRLSANPAWPSTATVVPVRPRRTLRGGYPLRGRHLRERGHLRVPVPFAVAHVDSPEERIVLQVLRQHAVVDLDVAQVGVAAGLAPSLIAPALDRLVRAGLVAGTVVGGRQRFGLP